MAQRLRFAQAVLLILPFTLLGGCKPKTKNTPVVVHVLRDLRSVYGVELDRRLLEFQGSNPRLSDGQLIVIQSATGDYKDTVSYTHLDVYKRQAFFHSQRRNAALDFRRDDRLLACDQIA